MNAAVHDLQPGFLHRVFTPDHVRYEGVRPIHVYLLRLARAAG